MTRTVSMSTAINEAMKISMRRDENVILIGEDVAGGAQVDHLQDDEAWGGVLGVTKALYKNLLKSYFRYTNFRSGLHGSSNGSCGNRTTSDC